MANQIIMTLKPQEAALIQTMREKKYCEMKLVVRDGIPFRGEEVIQDLNFTDVAKEKGFLKSNNLGKAS